MSQTDAIELCEISSSNNNSAVDIINIDCNPNDQNSLQRLIEFFIMHKPEERAQAISYLRRVILWSDASSLDVEDIGGRHIDEARTENRALCENVFI